MVFPHDLLLILYTKSCLLEEGLVFFTLERLAAKGTFLMYVIKHVIQPIDTIYITWDYFVFDGGIYVLYLTGIFHNF